MSQDSNEKRVVLGRKNPQTFAGFQWTGEEPEGLSDLKMAEVLGAVWEDDELVTYNKAELHHNYEHSGDGYLYDSD